MARCVARLFDDGDTSPWNGDDSRADQSLCRRLAYWTNLNSEQVDRLFRRSALYRPKWDRPDYRTRTIQTAMAAAAEDLERFYGGSASANRPAATRSPNRKPRQPRQPKPSGGST